MNATKQLIEDYVAEYRRVNGCNPEISRSKGWIKLNGDNFRIFELKSFLDVLKLRPTKTN